ncbi:hypothetical protein CNYM01_03136 [Colletotrichum nymphaeae SA-01]|nr:hypothetical protein CNYM01_03136 [Colletotrichum nymphaeae SA-01]
MPSADAQKGQLQTVLENKGIRFQFKTGSANNRARSLTFRTNTVPKRAHEGDEDKLYRLTDQLIICFDHQQLPLE